MKTTGIHFVLFNLFTLISFACWAQIVYTDVDPDSTISAPSTPGLARYEIDLNNDNTIDFYLKHFRQPNNIINTEFYTMIAQEGEVLVDGNDAPFALDDNDSIYNNRSQWVNKAGSSTSSALFMNVNWVGKEDKFVGLRFKLSGQWHYGWIRLSVPADTSSIIVKDYAYNAIANEPIVTGQVFTGIKQTEQMKQFSVYPNPIKDNLIINVSNIENASFKLYSITGRLFKDGSLEHGINQIPLRNVAPGSYILQIQSEELILESKRLLIR